MEFEKGWNMKNFFFFFQKGNNQEGKRTKYKLTSPPRYVEEKGAKERTKVLNPLTANNTRTNTLKPHNYKI